MPFDFFNSTIHVRIYRNRFLLRHIQQKTDLDVSASEPFTTDRLLVGQFSSAEKLLKASIKELMRGKFLAASPLLLMQPMEMTEGGLSEVEERAILELGFGAGARKVKVHVGSELLDDAVQTKMREK